MNTAYGRLLIISRDTASAAGSLTDYHRCLTKIQARTESLMKLNGRSLEISVAIIEVERNLDQAKRLLGQVLGELDKATAIIETERKRTVAEWRKKRESR